MNSKFRPEIDLIKIPPFFETRSVLIKAEVSDHEFIPQFRRNFSFFAPSVTLKGEKLLTVYYYLHTD